MFTMCIKHCRKRINAEQTLTKYGWNLRQNFLPLCPFLTDFIKNSFKNSEKLTEFSSVSKEKI